MRERIGRDHAAILSREAYGAPMLRTGDRGSGEFKEISWDEALELAAKWLGKVRENDPRRLAFFTGRDQSQSLTGLWAIQFGTPNFAAHGGFCSVNMATAGLYTLGGAFWEFWGAGLGTHQILSHVWRGRGARFQSAQGSPWQN